MASDIEKIRLQVDKICGEDDQLKANVAAQIDWGAAKMCGLSFDELHSLDFRRRSGRKIKRMLCIEDTDAPEALGVPEHVQRKRVRRIKAVGKLLYGSLHRCPFTYGTVEVTMAHRISRWVAMQWARRVRRERGICFYAPHLSINGVDCVTMCDICTIPRTYFISMTIDDPTPGVPLYYSFDIRQLNYMIEQNMDNPYTGIAFTPTTIQYVQQRIVRLKALGYCCASPHQVLDANTPKKTAAQLKRDRVIELCQQFDKVALTNTDWVLDLTTAQLKEWWVYVEDVINWRSEITPETRAKVVPGGAIFQTAQKTQLQAAVGYAGTFEFVVGQMEHLVNDAEQAEDRALGAMYALTGLTICCEPARIALPWLYQPPNIQA